MNVFGQDVNEKTMATDAQIRSLTRVVASQRWLADRLEKTEPEMATLLRIDAREVELIAQELKDDERNTAKEQ